MAGFCCAGACAALHKRSSHGNIVGNSNIGCFRHYILDLNSVGQHITHLYRLAIAVSNRRAIERGDGNVLHRLIGVRNQAQLAVVAQVNRVMGIIGCASTVGVGHDGGGTGLIAVVFSFGSGIILQGVIAVDYQGRCGVRTCGDVPIAILLDQRCIGRNLHMNQRGLFHGGIETLCILGRIGPVIVFPHIVGAAACRTCGNCLAVCIYQQGVLLIGIEGVVRSGIKGRLGHSPVVAVQALGPVPVVGEEIVSTGLGIIVHRATAINHLAGIVRGNNKRDIFGSDGIPQTYLIDHPGRLPLLHTGSINRIVILIEGLGDQHLFHGQQACRSADDHSLPIGGLQLPLYPDHKIQVLVLRIGICTAGLTVEEVGAADIVRIRRDLGACVSDIADGVIFRKSDQLYMLILLAGVVSISPPYKGVVEVAVICIVRLIGRITGSGQQVINKRIQFCFTFKALIGCRQVHTGLDDLAQLRVKLFIGTGCSIGLQILGKGRALIQVAVCHNALHVLDFHVLADGIVEVHIAVKVVVAGSDLGGRGNGLMLNGGDQFLENRFHLAHTVGAEILVVIGDAACIAHAVDIFLGTGDAVRGEGVKRAGDKGEVFITPCCPLLIGFQFLFVDLQLRFIHDHSSFVFFKLRVVLIPSVLGCPIVGFPGLTGLLRCPGSFHLVVFLGCTFPGPYPLAVLAGLVHPDSECVAGLIVFPVGLPAVERLLLVVICGVAIIPIAGRICRGISACGLSLGIQRDLGQRQIVAGQSADLHAHGVHIAAVFTAGFAAVVMLGDLALIVGGGHGGDESITLVRIAAGALLISSIITGNSGIVPGIVIISKCGLAVGNDDQEGNAGNRLVSFRIGISGIGDSCQDLGACCDTGLNIGAAILAVTEGIDRFGLLVISLSHSNGSSIPASDVAAVIAGGTSFTVDPLQMAFGCSPGVVGQGGQHIGSRAAAGAVTVALTGERHHRNPVLLIGLHQGLDGRVGGSDQGLSPVIIVHRAGGIQHEHHVYRHVGLGGKAHDLGSLRDGDQEIVLSVQGDLFTVDGHICGTHGLAHSDLTGI